MRSEKYTRAQQYARQGFGLLHPVAKSVIHSSPFLHRISTSLVAVPIAVSFSCIALGSILTGVRAWLSLEAWSRA